MKDRIPSLPGRVKMTLPDGTVQYVTLEMADEPTQEGTPLSKANLLTDETAAALGVNSADPTVNEALATAAQKIVDILGTVTPIAKGGTGQTTAPLAINALINGLTALTATGLADGDLLPLKDVSANTGKKVTLANLSTFISGKIPIPTSFIALTLDSKEVNATNYENTYDTVSLNFTPKFAIYFSSGIIFITDGKRTVSAYYNSTGSHISEESLHRIKFGTNSISFWRSLNVRLTYLYLAVGDAADSTTILQSPSQSMMEGDTTMLEQEQAQTSQAPAETWQEEMEEISSGGGRTYPVTLEIPVGRRVVGVTVA